MATILISTSSFAKEDSSILDELKTRHRVTLNPFGRKLANAELAELGAEAEGIIAGTETLDQSALIKLPKLKVISRCGSGLDNVDLETAKQRGIKVYNTPFGPTKAVAELTVGLIIGLLRKICVLDAGLKSGKWDKGMGSLLCGKNIGIIGFGRIGKELARILKVFECNLAYTDPFAADALSGLKNIPLDELLGWADIITIHVSGSNKIITEREIKKMKKGAWLVNVSRGGVVDEEALCRYLKDKHLAGAALDVFEKEPYRGDLVNSDNVILTPHIGSYAKEARILMEKEAVKNILEGLEAVK